MEVLKLGVGQLTLQNVYDVAVRDVKVELSAEAVQKIKSAHEYLRSKLGQGQTLYGVNTGFGLLSNVRIPDADIEVLQYNLLRSHACGMGAALDDATVRAMLLLRASNLALGHSGVSLALVEQILNLLNRGVIPVIPEQGSVGASGDLAPLSHLALVLVGEGEAKVKGKVLSGADALRDVGLSPLRLGPKEGLALINGTQFMAAMGTLALCASERICDLADLTGAMTLEALRGSAVAFDADIHRVRPHPGQIQVAENLRRILLHQGEKSQIALSHADCGKVQDPYSLRCMPQVHGATRDALVFVRQVLEREINSVTDNPLVFPTEDKILSGGNFHGQIVGIAMDLLAVGMAELASISEQRLQKLVNPATSDLPPFLTAKGGLNSGFMIVQVTAASIVSENKTLCHPASVDSIPTSADKEDHVSMGAWAARKAQKVITNVERVLSLELLAAAQAIEFHRPYQSSPSVEKIHALIRRKIPKVDSDRVFYPDFRSILDLIHSGEIYRILNEA